MAGDPTKTWKSSAQAALQQGASAAFVAMFAYFTTSLVPSLNETYWAPIAAVVVLYPQKEATRKASADRFLGTVIGSLIGWASATYWHQSVLLYGVAVTVAVGLCYLLRLENASRLCAVAVSVITLIPRYEPAYLIAFHRFVEVSYGVACAVAFTAGLEFVRKRLRSSSPR
jgi:uncharacterized membrane protein YgaE (UPF0421/DUF939 family)